MPRLQGRNDSSNSPSLQKQGSNRYNSVGKLQEKKRKTKTRELERRGRRREKIEGNTQPDRLLIDDGVSLTKHSLTSEVLFLRFRIDTELNVDFGLMSLNL